jgi:NADH-quinone oxidoreductase subunit N
MNDLAANVLSNAQAVLPELIVLVGSSLLLLAGCFVPTATPEQRRAAHQLTYVASALILLIGLLATFYPSSGVLEPAQSAFVDDAVFQVLRRAGFLIGIVIFVLMADELNSRYPAEQATCLLFTVVGVNLVAGANDLAAMFVALELVSIPTYVLLYLVRHDRPALEATAKYFLLSIFSSAFLLYGMSILLGCAGSTNFAWLRQSLEEPTGLVNAGMLQIALAMTVGGLSFRIAAVPFHFYAPDVFQGTSIPMAGFLSVVPKIVGFAALLRLVWSVMLGSELHPAFASLSDLAPHLFAILAILTMTVGNVLALMQSDLRRLLAYSSIAHAGYMLVGLSVLPGMNEEFTGAQAVLFYLLIYCVMTLGVFAVLLLLRKNGRPVATIADIDGLAETSPVAALVLAIFLFSLTGLPPTGGFWGKFNLFLTAWSSNTPTTRWLAIALAINAAIAAWYYLRLVRRAYLRTSSDTLAVIPPQSTGSLVGVIGCCAIGTLAIFFFPGALWQILAQLD